MRENMPTRKCCRGLDARKFSSAKICTFTVFDNSICVYNLSTTTANVIHLTQDIVLITNNIVFLQEEEMEARKSEIENEARLDAEVKELRKENIELKQYILALQGEVYGARLAAKYLDKELAGR